MNPTIAEPGDPTFVRATSLLATLQPDGHTSLSFPGAHTPPFEGGLYTLALLEAFSTPRTQSAGLALLAPLAPTPAAQADLRGQFALLMEAGFIRRAAPESTTASPDPSADSRGEVALGPGAQPAADLFSAPAIHIAMLEDRTRTGRYLRAIRETIQPGDVVVEIGTGTGILAAAAAQAGAARVYAIEGTPIAEAAARLHTDNGLSDRIRLIRSWSTQAELPERADVLISEIIGNEPLGEALLESTADAVARFLKPGARLIPRAIHLYGLPLTLPEDLIAQQIFTPAALTRWGRWYGLRFGSLAALNGPASAPDLILPQDLEDCQPLADPVLVAAIDLSTNQQTDLARQVSGTFAADGVLNGLVIGFRLQLTEKLWISTLPGEAGEDNHWLVSARVLPYAAQVAEGDRFTIDYAYHSARRTHQFAIAVNP